MTDIAGGCACGSVRYTLTDKPIFQLNCYCVDCQKGSGSAFAPLMVVASDRLNVDESNLGFFESKGDSGRALKRGFCRECGSPVLIRRPETPQIAFVHAGSLDDGTVFAPQAEVFTSRSHGWNDANRAMKRFPEASPPDLVRPVIADYFATRKP